MSGSVLGALFKIHIDNSIHLQGISFMPNNNLEENISHFILNDPTKTIFLPPKIAFQILETQKLHLGNQVPGSRKFCTTGSSIE